MIPLQPRQKFNGSLCRCAPRDDGERINSLGLLNHTGTDTRLDAVRDAVVVQGQVYESLEDWSQSQDTYTAFVNTIIGKPGRMLTYSRDSRFGASPTGVMDAIAKLSGRNLVIYQAEGAFIKPVHEYIINRTAPTIALIHTAMGGDELNHFDLLEGTVSIIRAQKIIEENLQEVDVDDSFTMNAACGTYATLAGQIQDLKSQLFTELMEEGMELPEAAEMVAQLDGLDPEELDAIIAAAEDPGEEEPQPVVAPKPIRKDKSPVVITEQDMDDLSDTIAGIRAHGEPAEEPATEQDIQDVSARLKAIRKERTEAGAVATPKPAALLEQAGGDVSQMGCNPEVAFAEYAAMDHTSPDHLKDTYGEKTKQAAKGVVVGAYEAKERVSEGQAGKPLPAAYFGGGAASEFFDQMFDERGGASDQAKAGAAQALDALAGATQCVDTCTFGTLSALGAASDKAGEVLGTGARRTVRALTGRQNWGQNAGDAVEGAFQAFSCVFGPGKSKIAQEAAALSKVAKEASLAAKLAKTAGKTEHVAADAVNKAPYSARLMEAMLRERYKGHTVTSGTLPEMFQPNVRLAGKSLYVSELGVSIPFDMRGLPIFDGFMKTEVRISGPLLEMDRPAHLRKATRTLREEIASGKVDAKIFTSEQLKMITAGEEKIPGYTWHHHQEMGRMQLVLDEAHEAVKHVGGYCLWKK